MNKYNELFHSLKSKDRKSVNSTARDVHEEVFTRTNCLSCGNCCKSAPPIITKKDIKRISKYLKISEKQVERTYVLRDINGELSFDRIPCHFLGEDNYCSIYEARPQACRSYPHTDEGNFTSLKKLHQINASICPAVEEILDIMERKLRELPSS